ncbi:FERM domain-containing protein 8 isoform X2 [Exaiptasia diaphana]|nr:FERM domain-containing protein 8 isoform X2 [Exaiptasia diaphana]KXJ17746.1 FERM domain-containing protein 8 [Exaiptasia diaphana]
MATIPEDDGLELKSVASSEEKEKTKQAKSDYKRTHSYPEDKKSVIKKAHHHKSHGSHPEMIHRMQSRGPLTVAVFLVEKAVRLLNLEDGKSATAGSMSKIMRETLSLPAEADKAFCIWLKSPLLQLQLKDHHVPYRLRKVWPELLQKFTNANHEAIEIDEPILSYQRNSFYPLQDEKKIEDNGSIKRLFEEARNNVLSGLYPVTKQESIKLGGVLLALQNGKFNENIHKLGFLKTLGDKITEYLPISACKVGWLHSRSARTTLEQQLLDSYKEASACTSGLPGFYKLFLERCWSLPYYGSVFFTGQIEQPSKRFSSLLGKSDLPVKVAVNREKIHIIDETKNDILLSLGFDELSWDYTPADEGDEDCLATFWVEFDSKEDDGTTTVQRLQIFSKQAVMIDAMVSSCVECEEDIDEHTTCEGEGGGAIRCRIDRLSLSKLEGHLARKKKTNVSFVNPFSRPQRQMSNPSGDTPR